MHYFHTFFSSFEAPNITSSQPHFFFNIISTIFNWCCLSKHRCGAIQLLATGNLLLATLPHKWLFLPKPPLTRLPETLYAACWYFHGLDLVQVTRSHDECRGHILKEALRSPHPHLPALASFHPLLQWPLLLEWERSVDTDISFRDEFSWVLILSPWTSYESLY